MRKQFTECGTVSICPDPVFIIGSPRSGTSALAWALHYHPAFWASKETDFLQPLFGSGQAAKAFAQASSMESWIQYNDVGRDEFLGYLGLGVNALITSRSDGKRWLDQTPSYTLFARELSTLFPGSRFLHIVRDGRAVVNSMLHFAEGVGSHLRDEGRLPQWATGFRDACETWATFCRSGLAFGAEQPDRVLAVRNEDLARQPEEGFRRILEFLGEGNHPGPANFFASSRINSSFVPNQWGDPSGPSRVRGPYPPSAEDVEGWHTWGDEQQTVFTTLAGPLMVELGYASESREVL